MFRIFVEKKASLRVDADKMQLEIRDFLKISGVSSLRILRGYDIENLSQEAFDAAKFTVFAEDGLDDIYLDSVDTEGCFAFMVTNISGQYNQRTDYAGQLLSALVPGENFTVSSFNLYLIYGVLSETDKKIIKDYYINLVENHEIPLAKPQSIMPSYKEPKAAIVVAGFADFNDAELESCKAEHSIALSLDNLYFCQQYYKNEGKNPTVTELKILDTYWSDHCRHSTFQTVLEDIIIADHPMNRGILRAQKILEQSHNVVYGGKDRPLCFMDIATLQAKKMVKEGRLTDLEKSEEINACSIETTAKVDGKDVDYIVMFKNETHNHPTEIEPFGGASTCLGGGIRDPLSGRAHVFGAMRVTGSGDPREEYSDTLANKLPQRQITKVAADGYSSYGNGIGLASTHLLEFYHPGFKAKRMECGALVAAVPKANVTRKNGVAGDVILLLGGKTGRDGLGGATGSSQVQSEDAFTENAAEVQKGNPIVQRGIVRLFRNPLAAKLIKKCNDFGAGGVSVAVGELADGLEINLDKVELKYPGLDCTEIAISESQERMAVLLAPEDISEFLSYAEQEGVTASHIATVTDSGRMIMTFGGKEVVNMSTDFLNSGGVRSSAKVEVTAPNFVKNNEITDIKSAWLNSVRELNVSSKKPIASQFDMSAGGTTVFAPFGGKYMATPELGLAMRLPLEQGETDTGVVMTVGYNPDLGEQSTFHAGISSIVESVSKVVAMGGDYSSVRLSLQEFFESLGEDSAKWGSPYGALMGAFLAQHELDLPAIGGKDSMSGTYGDITVPPTLISFALAVVDSTKLVSRSFKQPNSSVVIVAAPTDIDGVVDFTVLKANYENITRLIGEGKVLSSSTVGAGGISAALTEMCAGNEVGFAVDNKFTPSLFTPDCSAVILEVAENADFSGLSYTPLGKTTVTKEISVGGQIIPLNEILGLWQGSLETVFDHKFTPPKAGKDEGSTAVLAPIGLKGSAGVLIPIFPGSIGEYETAKEIIKAGGEVETVVFKNKTKNQIEASYKELAAAIDGSGMMIIPTGLTAGGEPEGTSKFISVILSNPAVAQAINELINRGGLILGIGEGFKALLKLGLIDNGKLVADYAPKGNITKNLSGRYFSGLVRVKTKKALPWYKEETVSWQAVSTPEGAVVMDEEDYDYYAKAGQILSYYVSEAGEIADNSTDNPLGSSYAIEGMISQNGQILGQMSCLERVDSGLYSNVSDKIKPASVFNGAVAYLNGN